MDPKQTSQLDPKFQEAYNKVMGTTITPSADTTPQSQAVTPPSPQGPVTSPTLQPTSVMPSDPPLPVAPVVMPHSTETIRIGGTIPVEPTQPSLSGVAAVSPKKGISPVILILGAIVFLTVYSLFWIKFLNIPVPFINQ